MENIGKLILNLITFFYFVGKLFCINFTYIKNFFFVIV